jgi:hypothetical protein
MKTGILTFEQFHGKKDLGSSRIRGHWIVKHWKDAGEDIGEAELFKYGQKYDAVIYQKAYFVEHAKAFKGVKILDMCDPDWLNWNCRIVEMLQYVDAVTVSSLELCKSVSKFTKKPVYYVPDRVDLENLPAPKVHTGPTRTVVWFGYSHNFPMLDSAISLLSSLKLDLIVVADNVYAQPSAFKIPVQNYPFSAQHHLADIQRGDVVLNPQHKKGKWKYKSENKTSIARAIGMPVAHDADELKKLLTEEQRIKVSLDGLEDIKKNFDVKLSVIDYKEVIQEVLKTKSV